MKWIPEGKAYLVWILVGLWVVLIAEYTLYPLWLKLKVNEGLIRLYQTQSAAYKSKTGWLDHVNRRPVWPANWITETQVDAKGHSFLVVKGRIAVPDWNRWLDELYASPVPMTIEACQLRRLPRNEIFVTIRLTL